MSEIVIDNIEVTEEVPAGEPTVVIPEGTLLAERVAQMFDMKPSEVGRDRSKLNTLIAYAKLKTDDHSPEGLKWAIRSLGNKLGTPALGEKLLPYLCRYAHLYLETKEIEKEMEKYHDIN